MRVVSVFAKKGGELYLWVASMCPMLQSLFEGQVQTKQFVFGIGQGLRKKTAGAFVCSMASLSKRKECCFCTTS